LLGKELHAKKTTRSVCGRNVRQIGKALLEAHLASERRPAWRPRERRPQRAIDFQHVLTAQRARNGTRERATKTLVTKRMSTLGADHTTSANLLKTDRTVVWIVLRDIGLCEIVGGVLGFHCGQREKMFKLLSSVFVSILNCLNHFYVIISVCRDGGRGMYA
jgi:hypothetical protein